SQRTSLGPPEPGGVRLRGARAAVRAAAQERAPAAAAAAPASSAAQDRAPDRAVAAPARSQPQPHRARRAGVEPHANAPGAARRPTWHDAAAEPQTPRRRAQGLAALASAQRAGP